jgi:NitT/TauT family transport system ATP-binding protein
VSTILSLQNVSLTYHSLLGETKALENINFNVKDGEFIAIVGPSGCGKTTILSLISCLIKPTSGKVLINNEVVTKVTNKTGYMFQKDYLFAWRNIYKNITLGLEVQKKLNKKNLNFINGLIKKYGLNNFKKHYPNELSGGMRQRVALIRTLALNPKILLLDEPFAALDYQTRLQVCDDVSKIISEENKTVVFVTHDIAEAISMADKVVVLSNRPASVKKIFNINFGKDVSPLKRREKKNFGELFDKIYKELKNE